MAPSVLMMVDRCILKVSFSFYCMSSDVKIKLQKMGFKVKHDIFGVFEVKEVI